MQHIVKSVNLDYSYLLQKARKWLQKSRIRHGGRKGYIQTVHLNHAGVRVDLRYDDGQLQENVDPLGIEFL